MRRLVPSLSSVPFVWSQWVTTVLHRDKTAGSDRHKAATEAAAGWCVHEPMKKVFARVSAAVFFFFVLFFLPKHSKIISYTDKS